MSRFTTAQRRVRFESLEQRQLLAGDVVVGVVQGDLVVQGDELDNHIAITAGAEAGSFVVTGLDGTTVHLEGQAAAGEVTVAGVNDDLRIDLGDGSDTLELADAVVNGSVSIRMGVGDDSVAVGSEDGGVGEALAGLFDEDVSVAIRGSLRISTDGGEDQVVVDDAAVRGFLDIHTGADNDSVSLGSLVDANGGVGLNGSSNGAGENGDDLASRLKVRAGLGVNLGDGDDTLNIHQVAAHLSAMVDAGAGNDMIDARLSSMFGLSVLGGDGGDHVTTEGLHARFLSVFAGAGNDTVEIIDSAFSSLWVVLGSGDDELATTNMEARLAVLLGGLGEDTFNQLGVDDFLFDVIDGFELPELISSPLGRMPFGVLPPFGGGLGHRFK